MNNHRRDNFQGTNFDHLNIKSWRTATKIFFPLLLLVSFVLLFSLVSFAFCSCVCVFLFETKNIYSETHITMRWVSNEKVFTWPISRNNTTMQLTNSSIIDFFRISTLSTSACIFITFLKVHDILANNTLEQNS